jgi:hypothetical protein
MRNKVGLFVNETAICEHVWNGKSSKNSEPQHLKVVRGQPRATITLTPSPLSLRKKISVPTTQEVV